MVNERTQFACVPKRVSEINKILIQSKKDGRYDFIDRTCFSGMLSIHPLPVRVAPTLHMLKFWDRNARCFRLMDGRCIEVTTERVGSIYDLPYGEGRAPITKEVLCGGSEWVEVFCNKFGLCAQDKNFITSNRLMAVLQIPEWSKDMSVMEYWRLYCLLCLVCLLIPTHSFRISCNYVQLLESPQLAEKYNWAGLVQDHLTMKLSPPKTREAEGEGHGNRPGGNFHCLVHLFYDFIECKMGSHLTCGLPRSLRIQDLLKYFGEDPHDKKVENSGIPALGGKATTEDEKGKGTKRSREPRVQDERCSPKVDKVEDQRYYLRRRLEHELIHWRAEKSDIATQQEVLARQQEDLVRRQKELDRKIESNEVKLVEMDIEDEVGCMDDNGQTNNAGNQGYPVDPPSATDKEDVGNGTSEQTPGEHQAANDQQAANNKEEVGKRASEIRSNALVLYGPLPVELDSDDDFVIPPPVCAAKSRRQPVPSRALTSPSFDGPRHIERFAQMSRDEEYVVDWLLFHELSYGDASPIVYDDGINFVWKEQAQTMGPRKDIDSCVVDALSAVLNRASFKHLNTMDPQFDGMFLHSYLAVRAYDEVTGKRPFASDVEIRELWKTYFMRCVDFSDWTFCFFAKQYFFPLPRAGHWVMFVADVPSMRLHYFNSLNIMDGWKSDEVVSQRLMHCFRLVMEMYSGDPWWGTFMPAFTYHVEQPDTHSCGIYTMAYMKFFRGGMPNGSLVELRDKEILYMLRRKFSAVVFLDVQNRFKGFILEKGADLKAKNTHLRVIRRRKETYNTDAGGGKDGTRDIRVDPTTRGRGRGHTRGRGKKYNTGTASRVH